MSEHTSKILKGSISVLAAQIAIVIIGFFYNPILVRLIGKSSYGLYATLLAIFSIGAPIIGLGLFNSIRKHMGEVKEKSVVASTGYMISMVYSAIALVLGVLIIILIRWLNLVEPEIYTALIFIIISLSLFPLFDAALSIIYGYHREGKAEFLRVGKKLISSVLALLLVYLGLGIGGIFLALAVSIIVMILLGLYLIRKKLKLGIKVFKRGLDRYGKEIFSFGGFTAVSIILAQALYHSDILIISYFKTSPDVGAYKAALVLAEILWLLPIAFQRVLLHHVSEIHSFGKTERMVKITNNIARYISLGMILFGFGLFVLAPPFMRIYFGPGFQESVLPLRILIIGSIGFGLARIITPVIEGTGHIKKTIRISAGIVALNIALNVILIPYYGIMGAAIATSISYFSKLIQYIYLLKKLGLEVMDRYPWSKIFILAVTFPAVLYSTLYVPIIDEYSLFIVPPLGLLIFLVESKLLGLFSWEELKNIKELYFKP